MDKKPSAALRVEQLHIRLTAGQKAVLAEAANRSALDLSSWLRALGMKEAASLGITEASMQPAAPPPPTTAPKKKAR